MPKYTLVYFDAKARGELIRLIFAEANQEYEDDRITFTDWPKRKPGKTPEIQKVFQRDL